MQAYKFSTQVTPDGYLQCPQDLLKNLSTNQLVRVIVLVDELIDTFDAENKNWSRLAAEQFFAGDNQEDAV